MLIKSPEEWRIRESLATPENVFQDRRRLITALGLGAIGSVLGLGHSGAAQTPANPTASPAPASAVPQRDPRFVLDRDLTAREVAASHNIFDELSGERSAVAQAGTAFVTHPWTVHVGGQVEKAVNFDVAELERRLGLEERLYRHRCVETWAMAVPWMGFPLARFVELCRPLAKARYVRFISAARPSQMPGWYTTRRVFPYYEALTLEEATNPLAFVATGIYGHPLPVQHGAPLRLVLPWKYGFKSAKSIEGIQFTSEKPSTFWNDLAPDKYSWTANVDPTSTAPWPQSHETMLGTEERRPTLPFNGYGEWVAELYD